MPRAVIADSDEDEDEDSFSLPSSPEPQPPEAHIIDLTAGAPSQDGLCDISGATSSTDPAFFQSVLDEQRAAARNLASRGPGPVVYRDGDGQVPGGGEAADEVAQVSSSEITAPGTFHRVVTGLAAMAPSSATNPATQRSYPSAMARMKSSAPGHDYWDVPSSAEDVESGPGLGAVHRPLSSVFNARHPNDPHDDGGMRKRRRLSKGGMVETSLRIETTESQLKKAHGESLPSTLSVPGRSSLTMGQRNISTASHGYVDEDVIGFGGGTGDTNAFSTAERHRRLDVAEGLSHEVLGSSHDALAPDFSDGEGMSQHVNTAMNPVIDSPVNAVETTNGPYRNSSRRRRSSSPDIIASNAPLEAKAKATKARQTKASSVGYSESDEEDRTTRLVEGDGHTKKARKPSSVKNRRTVLDDEDDGSASDMQIQEVYAEEDYDTDFVDAPKKQLKKQPKKRGRPKKKEKEKKQEEVMGTEESAPKETKKKRGRPRKSDARNHQPTEDDELQSEARLVDVIDDAHEMMKHEDHEQGVNQQPREDTHKRTEDEEDLGVGGQEVDERPDEVVLNETRPIPGAVHSEDQSEAVSEKSEPEAADKKTAASERSRPSSLAAAIAMTSKPLYRVGLSKRSRIAPLLKSLRKPSDEAPAVKKKGGNGTKKNGK